MFERLRNFGICTARKCVTIGPRCVAGLCVADCNKQHEYWEGHVCANGQRNTRLVPVVKQGFTADPVVVNVPEPGTSEELPNDLEGSEVFVALQNTGRATNATPGFPIKYVP
jgi:hypothetical protein